MYISQVDLKKNYTVGDGKVFTGEQVIYLSSVGVTTSDGLARLGTMMFMGNLKETDLPPTEIEKSATEQLREALVNIANLCQKVWS